jgi:phosphoribosyl-AMP cyclohydrolase / phosphoribosyl-ATP pyrophosphohydrolase
MTNKEPTTRMAAITPAAAIAADSIRWGADGLVPAIVQDSADGRVMMLAWIDAEALAATFQTGDVHFHSRSRGRLWRKGETSGNVLRLRSLALDCDGDALLLTVDPVGPTCHRGTRSCFDPPSPSVGAGSGIGAGPTAAVDPAPIAPQGFAWLERLWATIADRVERRPEGSYTARLIDGGVDAVARKVTEEATEVLIAAKDDAAAERLGTSERPDTAQRSGTAEAARAGLRTALSGEVADLLFHTLVLLAERGLPPAEVIATLRRRHAPD